MTNFPTKPPYGRGQRPGGRKPQGPRINNQIRVPTVRLIDQDGNMVGDISTAEALQKAVDAGLDLVEVSPGTNPPVCKILDYGKYKYEVQKKAKEAKKKQKVTHLKEIKIRPNIDTNDYNVKVRKLREFIEAQDKVKISLRFKGREIDHKEIGAALLKRIETDTEDIAKVESPPKFMGRQVFMVLAPK